MADRQGIEAVSMRTLAVQLGVGAASLYRYIDRKDELIDLMVDAVMGDDLQFEIRGDWRKDLRSFARGLRAMTMRHPWVAVHGAGDAIRAKHRSTLRAGAQRYRRSRPRDR